jgi:TPR repeat protein
MRQAGKGVKQSIAKAIKWFRLAAAQGHRKAQQRLESLSPDSRTPNTKTPKRCTGTTANDQSQESSSAFPPLPSS